jgi:hypothetical protein
VQEQLKQAVSDVSHEIQAKRDMVLVKKNLIELHDLDDLTIDLVTTRKVIKNNSMV